MADINHTDEQIIGIKKDLLDGYKSKAQIARDWGTSRSNVYSIAVGKTHREVGPDVVGKLGMPGDETVDLTGARPEPAAPVVPLDPTDQRVLDLEAKLLDKTNEIRIQNRVIKANSRTHGLLNAVIEELEPRIVPVKRLPSARVVRERDERIKEHLVVHLSDGHHDSVVDPESCGGLEEYNFDISCRRAENYIDKIIAHTQGDLGASYNFTDLTILAYGDHTSGEIHDAVSHSHFKNQFKNCLAIGKLHALMVRDLAPFFNSVNIVYLPGNHGRRSPKKDHHRPQNNFDYLIAKIAEMACVDLDNVIFTVPNAFSINLEINGVGFNISHGDDVRGFAGIPFYGMVRRQKNLICLEALNRSKREFKVKYFVMGHHHIAGSLGDMDGELLLNGAWIGTDPYSYNSFSGYREPQQWIHGVNPDVGITWRMNVLLRSDDDVNGPKRYKIEV